VSFLATLLITGTVAVALDATGTTVIDLRDEWAPHILSETVDLPQSYRRTFVALAA